MKIVCINHRVGGTIVTLDSIAYHFKPTPEDARHVAEVTQPRHIQRFLAIPEGYRSLETDDALGGESGLAPLTPADGTAGMNSLVPLENREVGGADLSDTDLRSIGKTDGSSDDSGNRADVQSGSLANPGKTMLDTSTDTTNAKGPDDDKPKDEDGKTQEELDALERDELVALYEQKFNKKPHHNLGTAKLREALAEEE